MARYHIDTKARLILVQTAIDQALGLRDAAGNATPREQLVYKRGVGTLPASQVLGPLHGCFDRPGTKARLVEADDGTAALDIDEVPPIDAALGTTVGGVVLPAAAALVQVDRPRDHSKLPRGVHDKLDDAYIAAVLDFQDTPARRQEIVAELQDPRANAAISRYLHLRGKT